MTFVRLAGLLAFTAWSAHCLGQNQKLTTWGDCSPIIETVNAPVTIICNVDKGLEEILRKLLQQQSAVQEYNRLSAELEKARTTTAKLRTDVKRMEASHEAESKQARDLLRKQLHEQARRQEELRADMHRRVNQVTETILDVMTAQMQARAARTDEEIQALKAQVAGNLDAALANLKAELQAEIQVIRADLDNVKERLSTVERFMKSAGLGQLTERVGFWGVNAGGGLWQDEKSVWVSLEHESLLPLLSAYNIRGSGFVELGFLMWSQERQFATLPGAAPHKVKEEHDLGLFGVGGRVLLPIGQTHAVPLGLSVGTTFGSDRTFYLAWMLGAERFHRSARFALELRYHWFHRIPTRDVQFNPFGPATIKEEEASRDIVTVGLRVSWH